MRKREKEKKINGKKIGKRIAAAALGGVMVLSLAACGDSEKEDVIRVGSVTRWIGSLISRDRLSIRR